MRRVITVIQKQDDNPTYSEIEAVWLDTLDRIVKCRIEFQETILILATGLVLFRIKL